MAVHTRSVLLEPSPIRLMASELLPDFLKGVRELPIDDRRRIVEQALLVFERYYVNLPLKEALHAAEPIRRLKLLQNQLRPKPRRPAGTRGRKQRVRKPKPPGDDLRSLRLDFHYQLHAIFNSVRDLHTSYSLDRLYDPDKKRPESPRAFLGFEIEVCYPYRGSPHRGYLVSHVTSEVEEAETSFQPGVEVLFWNGVPIERAVALNAELQAGGNAAARHARGLTLMTIRPLEISLPPDEDWVIVTYRHKVNRRWVVEDIKLDWQVIHYTPEPADEKSRFTLGVDHHGDVVREMRQRYFSPWGKDRTGDGAGSGGGSAGTAVTSRRAAAAPTPADPPEHAILTHEITEHVAAKLQHPLLMRAWIIDGEAVGQEGSHFGYIRIYSFKVVTTDIEVEVGAGDGDAGLPGGELPPAAEAADPPVAAEAEATDDPVDTFAQAFETYLKKLPEDGLVIDVRDNPGGDITAGERLLELLTPRKIEPERFQFISSLETLRLCHHNSAPKLPHQVDWSAWVDSLDQALATGTGYSRGFPITRQEDLNLRGQVYHGPVLLITSALSYSTTDIFAAGFVDHKIGRVLGVDANTGAGGANVMKHKDLRAISPDSSGLRKLPDGTGIRVALRRALRVGAQSGTLLEDLGVPIPLENRYRMTRDDLLCHNKDLITEAVRLLADEGTPRKLVPGTPDRATSRTGELVFDVEVLNVTHLAIFIDDFPFDTLTREPDDKPEESPRGQPYTFRVRIPGTKAKVDSVVRLEAFDGKDLVASRRLELASI